MVCLSSMRRFWLGVKYRYKLFPMHRVRLNVFHILKHSVSSVYVECVTKFCLSCDVALSVVVHNLTVIKHKIFQLKK
jgi:hypothetical protein